MSEPSESEEIALLLKREVVLMREILASMYEEEKALLEKNPKALQSVMSRRNAPLQDLKNIREEVASKIRAIPGAVRVDSEESCEVMLLADQIIALIEKMNVQNHCLSRLMQETYPHWKELMQGSFSERYPPHPTAFRATQEKKRKAMLTVEIPKD